MCIHIGWVVMVHHLSVVKSLHVNVTIFQQLHANTVNIIFYQLIAMPRIVAAQYKVENGFTCNFDIKILVSRRTYRGSVFYVTRLSA